MIAGQNNMPTGKTESKHVAVRPHPAEVRERCYLHVVPPLLSPLYQPCWECCSRWCHVLRHVRKMWWWGTWYTPENSVGGPQALETQVACSILGAPRLGWPQWPNEATQKWPLQSARCCQLLWRQLSPQQGGRSESPASQIFFLYHVTTFFFFFWACPSLYLLPVSWDPVTQKPIRWVTLKAPYGLVRLQNL